MQYIMVFSALCKMPCFSFLSAFCFDSVSSICSANKRAYRLLAIAKSVFGLAKNGLLLTDKDIVYGSIALTGNYYD
jgi:lipopolysaccharide export LptBFGC system permease protein LptF